MSLKKNIISRATVFPPFVHTDREALPDDTVALLGVGVHSFNISR